MRTIKKERGRTTVDNKKQPGRNNYIRAFKARLKMARSASGLSQGQLARALGIPANTYAKYENRSKSTLPLWLMGPFCDATGCDMGYLLTGQGSALSPRLRTGHKSPRAA